MTDPDQDVLRDIFDNRPTPALLLTIDGDIVLANRRAPDWLMGDRTAELPGSLIALAQDPSRMQDLLVRFSGTGSWQVGSFVLGTGPQTGVKLRCRGRAVRARDETFIDVIADGQ